MQSKIANDRFIVHIISFLHINLKQKMIDSILQYSFHIILYALLSFFLKLKLPQKYKTKINGYIHLATYNMVFPAFDELMFSSFYRENIVLTIIVIIFRRISTKSIINIKYGVNYVKMCLFLRY